jgi:outer membrane lipoprotein-sorting protein
MRVLAAFILVLTIVVSARSQTAAELVSEIERSYFATDAVKATFSFAGESAVTLYASSVSKSYRYETSSELVVCDGKTIWNYNKRLNQTTIDNARWGSVGSKTEMKDFFDFKKNYSAEITKHKNDRYELMLTPSGSLTELFKKMEITSLSFDLLRNAKKGTVTIKGITTNKKGIKEKAGNVKIASLKTMPKDIFIFTSPKGAKVVDIRE